MDHSPAWHMRKHCRGILACDCLANLTSLTPSTAACGTRGAHFSYPCLLCHFLYSKACVEAVDVCVDGVPTYSLDVSLEFRPDRSRDAAEMDDDSVGNGANVGADAILLSPDARLPSQARSAEHIRFLSFKKRACECECTFTAPPCHDVPHMNPVSPVPFVMTW